jgi:phage shock protein C
MTETPYRKLYRSHTNRMVAGVCGGIAEYSNMDPAIVRVLFVLLAFITGGGALLAYPILWIIVPQPQPQPQSAPWPAGPVGSTNPGA